MLHCLVVWGLVVCVGDVCVLPVPTLQKFIPNSPCIHLHTARAANSPYMHAHTYTQPHARTHTCSHSLCTINRQNVSDNKALRRANSFIQSSAACVAACRAEPSPAGTLSFNFPQILESIGDQNGERRKKNKLTEKKGSNPGVEEWVIVTNRRTCAVGNRHFPPSAAWSECGDSLERLH